MECKENVNAEQLNEVAGGNEETKETLEKNNQENGLSYVECYDCGFRFSLNSRGQCPKCGSTHYKIIV